MEIGTSIVKSQHHLYLGNMSIGYCERGVVTRCCLTETGIAVRSCRIGLVSRRVAKRLLK